MSRCASNDPNHLFLVIPAKAGIHSAFVVYPNMDPGLRWDDGARDKGARDDHPTP